MKGETIKGAVLERILFPKVPDPENRFMIGRFFCDEKDLSFTALGNAAASEIGLSYTLAGGEWKENFFRGKREDQFHFDFAIIEKPRDIKGIEIFLKKRFDGIGPAKAKKIVSELGVDTIEILRDDPEEAKTRLPSLLSIIDSISEQLKKYEAEDRVLIALEKLFAGIKGIPKNLVHRCFERWEAEAEQVIMENPYRLIELYGIGFLIADQIAVYGVKIPHDSIYRKCAALRHVLKEHQAGTGSTWMFSGSFKSGADELIRCDSQAGVDELFKSGEIVQNEDGFYSTFNFCDGDEWTVADALLNMLPQVPKVMCLDCLGSGCAVCRKKGVVPARGETEVDFDLI